MWTVTYDVLGQEVHAVVGHSLSGLIQTVEGLRHDGRSIISIAYCGAFSEVG